MQKSFIFEYQNKQYPVIVTYKNIRKTFFRYRDGAFYVSCSIFTTLNQIKKGLERFAPELITYGDKHIFTVDNAYLFGHKLVVSESGGIIKFTDGSSLKYLDLEDLEDKLKQIYKDYMIQRTHYYESLMGVDISYKVRFRKMSSRYGSNSLRTHSICYMDDLYPYSSDILDSLIVHELAHHFVHNHSKAFYAIVYKYCPNYNKDNRKLKRRQFV